MSVSTATSVQSTLTSVNDLLAYHSSLLERTRTSQTNRLRAIRALPSTPSSPQVQSLLKTPLIPSPPRSPSSSPPSSPLISSIALRQRAPRSDLPPAKRARWERYKNYVPEEETIRNDYSQRYVDGGEWPQNWVLGADPDRRFEEYPKQQRLLALKKLTVQSVALPPTYLPFSQLSSLSPSKFDVILIDPPFSSSYTWETLQELPIPALASDPSFVLMWVGSGAGDGLERGREVMAKWGFRRCEDIVWIKTNKDTNLGPGADPPTTSLLTRTKQHCLMGIRGTVRRSTDSWFVHCNVDTDVMIYEPDPSDPTLKPPETYTLIENFCLGLRRLEIFGRARTLRRGWVTALAEGEEESLDARSQADGAATQQDQIMDDEQEVPVKWDRDSWESKIKELVLPGTVKLVVPMTPEIDALRPKSPVRGGSSNVNNATQSSMGAGLPQLPNLPQNLSTMAVPMAAQSMGMNSQSPRLGTGGFGGGGNNYTRSNRDPNQNRMMGPPRLGMVNMGGMSMGNTPVMGGMGAGVGMSGGMGMGGMNGGMGMGSGMNMMPWQDMSGMAGMNTSGGMAGMGVGGMGNMQGHSMGMNAGGPPPRFNQSMGLSGGVSLGTTGLSVNSGGFGVGQQHSQMGGMGMGGWPDGQFMGSGMGVGDGGMMGMGSVNVPGIDLNGMGMGQMGNMSNMGMGGLGMGMNQWG